MPMRLSGLMSGMDTESIISQLVEAKKTKVTKAVKAQKTLKYKQDAWKPLNTQIKNFYLKTLSNMRYEGSFVKKTTKVSNSSIVSVITGESAMNGVQSLKVNQLARSGYLTGGKMELIPGAEKRDENGEIISDKVTADTKLSELGFDLSGSTGTINVQSADGLTPIKVDGSTTVGSFVSALKSAGLNANFDAANERIYVTSKGSGAANEFEITAGDSSGRAALEKLGLSYGTGAENSIASKKEKLFKSLKELADSDSGLEADLKNKKLEVKDSSGNSHEVSVYDFLADQASISPQWTVDDIDDSDILTIVRDVQIYANDNKASISGDLNTKLDAWVEDAVDVVKDMRRFAETKKTAAADAEIELNGATYTSTSNSFNINGLTLTVNSTTAPGEEVTITTQDDTDGIYDMIKNFFKEYNTMINQMDKLYNADSAKGYEPLTDEEKEAMSDSAIEEWENKIKESILRKDSSLGTISSTLKTLMMEPVEVDGKKMYLSSFGIGTLNYFTAPENEKNAYHIDGDSDDAETSGNADKLKTMIANDPDTVVKFFTGLANKVFDEVGKVMEGDEYSSMYSVYDDKKMQEEYDDYTVKIKELEKKLADYEDKWYAKFAAMETALAKMQSNASAVTSLLGG
ncbi:flagellar filament capping protein FliD [Acetatifactor muris]|uniref:Flagellar hook-associated protein 2 n=1 Tax=Acetatifactor muris TaxID=879566 RepID=A0A2K4ZAQ1_9FIRM|nr:flagellar filament capping protein FliD [Acetatifactor muris]MCR2048754.1 flagellar filament capping protein FliD [Acetatifactor muris]SOY27546.1 flagellar capping protein [Acetatifactor muris]